MPPAAGRGGAGRRPAYGLAPGRPPGQAVTAHDQGSNAFDRSPGRPAPFGPAPIGRLGSLRPQDQGGGGACRAPTGEGGDQVGKNERAKGDGDHG